MTGHLLVPAVDPDLPATLSRSVLTGLLRDELGFQGAVITDAMEMRAVVDRFGFEGAVVPRWPPAPTRSASAASTPTRAPPNGCARRSPARWSPARLAEDRLIEAAKRVEHLAAWAATARAGAVPGPWYGTAGSPVGLAAARRAVKVGGTAPAVPLAGAPHVVELSPPAQHRGRHRHAVGAWPRRWPRCCRARPRCG